jgi:hypothetical protein
MISSTENADGPAQEGALIRRGGHSFSVAQRNNFSQAHVTTSVNDGSLPWLKLGHAADRHDRQVLPTIPHLDCDLQFP